MGFGDNPAPVYSPRIRPENNSAQKKKGTTEREGRAEVPVNQDFAANQDLYRTKEMGSGE